MFPREERLETQKSASGGKRPIGGRLNTPPTLSSRSRSHYCVASNGELARDWSCYKTKPRGGATGAAPTYSIFTVESLRPRSRTSRSCIRMTVSSKEPFYLGPGGKGRLEGGMSRQELRLPSAFERLSRLGRVHAVAKPVGKCSFLNGPRFLGLAGAPPSLCVVLDAQRTAEGN